jgi:hypothetical protein
LEDSDSRSRNIGIKAMKAKKPKGMGGNAQPSIIPDKHAYAYD